MAAYNSFIIAYTILQRSHIFRFYQRADICRRLFQARSYFYDCTLYHIVIYHIKTNFDTKDLINVSSPSCGMARELNTVYRDQWKYYVGFNIVLYWRPFKKRQERKTKSRIIYVDTLSRNRKRVHVTRAPLLGWLRRLDTLHISVPSRLASNFFISR